MPALNKPGWLDRLSASLREHEARRAATDSAPSRYEILGELSRGAMGIVYRALDLQVGREVALKVLRPEEGVTAELHERFVREAKLAGTLDHPNIVPVYDFGPWRDRNYIAMKLVDGVSLDQAKLDRREALAAIRDTARALHYAHQQGVIHRDIKPSNLMLDRDGRIYLTDFGVARREQDEGLGTNPGTVIGTPAYMSPEQAQGLRATERSDVYSLGATLYELVTGRPPYTGRDSTEVVEAVRSHAPPAPRKLIPTLSRNVEAIIQAAMARAPEDRFSSAEELAINIDFYLKDERPPIVPRRFFFRLRREFVRHPWRSWSAVVLMALVGLALVATGYFFRAYLDYRRALSELDPEKRRQYLASSAVWFPPAARLREEDRKKELAILAAKAEADKEEAVAEARKQVAILEQNLKTSNTEHELRETIGKTYVQARLMLSAQRVNEARSFIDLLKTQDPAKYEECLADLKKLEFAQGMEKLRGLVTPADAESFARLFAEIKDTGIQLPAPRREELARAAREFAERLADQKRFTESISWFKEAESLGLKDTRLYERRGLAWLALEAWDEAERDLGLFRAHSAPNQPPNPRFAALPLRRAEIAMSRGEWAQALRELDAASALDPALARVYHDRGLVRYRGLGLSVLALEQDLKKALELNPNLPLHFDYCELAIAYARQKGEDCWKSNDPQECQTAWRMALAWLERIAQATGSRSGPIFLERAKMRRRLGDYSDALRDAENGGDSAEAFLLRGALRYVMAFQGVPRREHLARALDELDRSIALDDQVALSHSLRGMCRLELGENGRSLEDLKGAVLLKPESPNTHYQLAKAFLEAGRWQEAADSASRVLSNTDHFTEDEFFSCFRPGPQPSYVGSVQLICRNAYLARAEAQLKLEQYSLCVDDCTHALRIDPTYSSAYLLRGYARGDDKVKRYKEAKEDFAECLRYSNDPDEKKNAREWLARCSKFVKE